MCEVDRGREWGRERGEGEGEGEGEGRWVVWQLMSTLWTSSHAVPDPVGMIQVLTYANEVQLSWTPPTSPVGRLHGYSVSCSKNSPMESLLKNVTEHTCEGLFPNTTYEVVITASNKFGKGSPAMETVSTACGCECVLPFTGV